MKYWDSSALVPLWIAEPQSPWVRQALAHDAEVVTWWATATECAGVLARNEREKGRSHSLSFAALVDDAARWQIVPPSPAIEAEAVRLLRAHPLRAADALQLAAALAVAEHRPASLQFITSDRRLAEAAAIEGFPVILPGTE